MSDKFFVVTFDIADQSFKKYTFNEWAVAQQTWRKELEEDLGEDVWEMQPEEIVEAYFGEEMFFEVYFD
jgi:hypothetical protein